MADDPSLTTAEPIINRMEDCGDGRHVGWWMENLIGETALLIEIDRSVVFSCYDGPRAVTFVTSREKGTEIIRAAANAIGLEIVQP